MSKLAVAIANAIFDHHVGKLVTNEQLIEQLSNDIDNVNVKVYREDKNIPLPVYGKEGDACCDVYAKSVDYDVENDKIIIHTGLHFALPDDYEMELRPRSSLTKTNYYVANSPMTLDWGYRGELLVIFKNRTDNAILKSVDELISAVRNVKPNTLLERDYINKFTIAAREELDKVQCGIPFKEGDRICQLLVRRREQITWNEVETVEDLGTTERGNGGFGSTGKREITIDLSKIPTTLKETIKNNKVTGKINSDK